MAAKCRAITSKVRHHLKCAILRRTGAWHLPKGPASMQASSPARATNGHCDWQLSCAQTRRTITEGTHDAGWLLASSLHWQVIKARACSKGLCDSAVTLRSCSGSWDSALNPQPDQRPRRGLCTLSDTLSDITGSQLGSAPLQLAAKASPTMQGKCAHKASPCQKEGADSQGVREHEKWLASVSLSPFSH